MFYTAEPTSKSPCRQGSQRHDHWPQAAVIKTDSPFMWSDGLFWFELRVKPTNTCGVCGAALCKSDQLEDSHSKTSLHREVTYRYFKVRVDLTQQPSCSGSYPPAQNVTWTSVNFKTILSWGPKPSSDYTYTVEYSSWVKTCAHLFMQLHWNLGVSCWGPLPPVRVASTGNANSSRAW